MGKECLAAAMAAVLSTGCGWDEVQKPSPPDTTVLRASFDAPSGDLSQLSPETLNAVLIALVEDSGFCGLSPFAADQCPAGMDCARCPTEERVSAMLTEVAKALRASDPQGVSIPGVSGALQIESICRGFQEPSPDPAHGMVQAQLGFTGVGIDPVVWGRFLQCEERVGAHDRPWRFNGSFILSFEPEPIVPFDEIAELPFVFSYDGTLFDPGVGLTFPVRGVTRQRIDGKGPREFLIDSLVYGTFVALLDNGQIDVRGANNRYLCDLELKTCTPAALD